MAAEFKALHAAKKLKALHTLVRVGLHYHDHQIRIDSVGDEHLYSIKYGVIPLLDRAGRDTLQSLPVPGSVIAIALISFPVQNLDNQRCFFSSVAKNNRYGDTMSLCKPNTIPL